MEDSISVVAAANLAIDTADGSALAASRGEVVRRREQIASEDRILRGVLAKIIEAQRGGTPVRAEDLGVTVDP